MLIKFFSSITSMGSQVHNHRQSTKKLPRRDAYISLLHPHPDNSFSKQLVPHFGNSSGLDNRIIQYATFRVGLFNWVWFPWNWPKLLCVSSVCSIVCLWSKCLKVQFLGPHLLNVAFRRRCPAVLQSHCTAFHPFLPCVSTSVLGSCQLWRLSHHLLVFPGADMHTVLSCPLLHFLRT